MSTTIHSSLIEQFLASLASFPTSTSEPTVQYNTGKLIDILREKEVMEVCGVTKEEFDAVNKIDLALGKVVQELVMEKHIQQSFGEYLELEKQIENETTGDLYIYAKQGALSVKSLYYYKANNWAKAIDFTIECIALNDYLVERGMHSLNLRIYEQNKNISRVLYKSGNSGESALLLKNLFDYLLSGKSNNLYGSIFQHEESWDRTPIIRETYAYELMCMIVEDMIWFNGNSTELFPMDWCKDLDFEVDNPNRQVIYNFLYINRQMHLQNYEELIDCLIYYFEQPISIYYEIFKVFLLLDLNKLIQLSDYSEKEVAEFNIKQFMFEQLKMTERMKKFISDKVLIY